MNLNDLRTFEQLAESGTIAAAAQAEGVPRSTITRRIARLEAALDVELLRRAGRSVALTEDGRLLHRLTTGALREVADAVQALRASSSTPRGRLVVAAPDFARSEPFARLMVAYRARYPAVEVEVRIDNRVVDLVHDGVDVAIRAHTRSIPGAGDLMARVFDLPPMGFYASPAYLHRHPAPRTLDALAEHPLVLHAAGADVPKRLSHASSAPDAPEETVVDLGPAAYRANDTLMVRALVEADAGIGLLPDFIAAPAVTRGSLSPVLPAWSLRVGRIAVLWPASRHLAPRVRAFVEMATALFGAPQGLA